MTFSPDSQISQMPYQNPHLTHKLPSCSLENLSLEHHVLSYLFQVLSFSLLCVFLPFLHPAFGIPVFIHITFKKEVKNSICNTMMMMLVRELMTPVCH